MTRTVLIGPPLRRGLAWGLAVLLGAAVLIGTRSGSDVAAKDEESSKLPADLAMIPGEAFGFATVRVADLWNDEGTKELRTKLAKENPEGFKEAQKAVGVPPEDIERITFVMPKVPAPNDQGPTVVIIVSTNKPYDQKKVLDFLLPEGKDGRKEETRKGKTYYTLAGAAVYPIDKTAFLMGPAEAVEQTMDQAGKSSEATLGPAVAAAAGKHQFVGGMRPTALNEAYGNMIPAQLDAIKPLLEVPLAYATLDLGKEAKLQARLICAGESDTKNTVTAIKGMIALLEQFGLDPAEKELEKRKNIDQFKKVFQEFRTALKKVPIEAKGKEVTGELVLKTDLPTLSQAILQGLVEVRGAAGNLSSGNNLKQMALAMHNYADTNGALPAAAISKGGKPLLSWRVAILPYIEQDNLYQQFNLEEPWDSDHNKKLLEQMPRTYMVPSEAQDPKAKPTKTHYRVFHGKGTVFEGDKGVTFADITDGTSNTILIVEAAEAVPWTKPDELPFDPKKDLPKLGLKGAETFNAAFADGAVHTLKKDIDKDKLKALITRNGGEAASIDD
jgi:hypothetical protein